MLDKLTRARRNRRALAVSRGVFGQGTHAFTRTDGKTAGVKVIMNGCGADDGDQAAALISRREKWLPSAPHTEQNSGGCSALWT